MRPTDIVSFPSYYMAVSVETYKVLYLHPTNRCYIDVGDNMDGV